MSNQPDELDEPTEPVEPTVGPEETPIHEPPSEPESEPEPEAQPEPPSSETMLEGMSKQLDAATKSYVTRIGNVLGDQATEYLPCPLCFRHVMGFVHPKDVADISDEERLAVASFVGGELGGDRRDAEGVHMCDRCDGWGQLRYPTRVPHVQEQMCPACGGQGYVLDSQQPSNVTPLPAFVPPPAVAPVTQGAACPLCGAPGSAGTPHWCAPAAGATGQ